MWTNHLVECFLPYGHRPIWNCLATCFSNLGRCVCIKRMRFSTNSCNFSSYGLENLDIVLGALMIPLTYFFVGLLVLFLRIFPSSLPSYVIHFDWLGLYRK